MRGSYNHVTTLVCGSSRSPPTAMSPRPFLTPPNPQYKRGLPVPTTLLPCPWAPRQLEICL